MDRKDFEVFLYQTCDIGVPHLVMPGRLFFLKGIVIEVDDEFLRLKLENGFKLIRLSEIREIRRLQ